jgi:arginyl-tRNA--protein-N-Asp/Glu arginylyltransferase
MYWIIYDPIWRIALLFKSQLSLKYGSFAFANTYVVAIVYNYVLHSCDATVHALILLARFLKSARLLPTPLLPLRNCCSVAYFVRVTCTQLVCSHEAVRCVTHLSHLVTDRILCGHALCHAHHQTHRRSLIVRPWIR